MSKDIRSFFKAVPRHEKNKIPPKESHKRTVEIRDSDDEDIIKCTPEQKIKPQKRCAILSSDSEDETAKSSVVKSNTTKKEKLKPINIDDVFNDTPVKQSKVDQVVKLPTNQKDTNNPEKKSKRKSKKTEVGIHDDKDFEKILLDLDGDALLEKIDFDKTINEEPSESKSGETVGSSRENSTTKSVCIKKNDERKRARKSSDESPSKKPKLDLDSSIDPDQDKYERKRYSAMLYQKYKNRGGPKHHGEKELPKGKPNCLQGLTFLKTGVLDSLESEEFENLIAEHGGRVVHGVSKKVNYIVVGEDAGPAKLAKAEQYHIPQLSEDDLLDMILVKSGIKPKFKKHDSGDTGFASGSEEFSCNNSTETMKKSEEIQNVKKSPKKLEKEKLKTSPIKAENLLKDSSPKSEVDDRKNLKRTLECDNMETKKRAAITETTHTESRTFTANSDPSSFTWTDKYKPVSMKNIIGQQDPNSNMNKLKKWLANWHKNQNPEVRKKLPVPTPWKQNDGAYFKCALLSGPPGVGKTTTAHIVSKELGFDVVEFNASDTRNKKSLHQEVSQLLSTNTIVGFTEGKSKKENKRVLIMDEVDGMAGNEDRGGIQELIALIKKTKVPIICICNDRNIQKMRSLVQYCYDLKFTRPSTQQIMGALMSICFKEGLNIKPDALSELINGTGGDIRQALTHLSMWSAADKCLPLDMVKKDAQAARKDLVLGLWDVIRKVFSEADHKNMSISDKSRLFFFDYSMGPLFVQENYINAVPNVKSEQEKLKRLAKSADSLSMGDLIEAKIRGSNNWALLETQAFFSSVFPGYYMAGTLKSINFPSWLGKNSKKNKLNRMLSELHVHTRTCTSGNLVSMRMDYLKPLRDAIVNPMRQKGMDGISEAVEIMKSYNLLREDLNNIVELCEWAHTKNPFNSIDSKVKAAFTRLYNKECPLLPFAPGTVSKKRAQLSEDDIVEEEGVVESDEDADDVTSDSLIKVKKRKDTSKTKRESAKSSTKTTTSKEKGTGKGRTSKARK